MKEGETVGSARLSTLPPTMSGPKPLDFRVWWQSAVPPLLHVDVARFCRDQAVQPRLFRMSSCCLWCPGVLLFISSRRATCCKGSHWICSVLQNVNQHISTSYARARHQRLPGVVAQAAELQTSPAANAGVSMGLPCDVCLAETLRLTYGSDPTCCWSLP